MTQDTTTTTINRKPTEDGAIMTISLESRKGTD